MASDTGAPREDGRITPKDVAASTAIGAATKLGVARRKGKVAQGAAAGVGTRAGSKHAGEGNSLLTALAVVVVMVGMLALMIVAGK